MDTKLIIVGVVIVLLTLIGSITYTVNQPNDLVCEDFVRSTESTYTMLNCREIGSSRPIGYNLTLLVKSQIIE